ncbi:SapC family protein [Azospirillum isscasi]|uniref:SapC family protein n=1 Tax=Azospirillum isscasi TaxID=3053926 RepID=A0ABU0WGG7_9PROT|nr:SapC family protein [Azospirillum isscasi]MDQ2103306.1 SapC family protein [Azospirillum isscasi]
MTDPNLPLFYKSPRPLQAARDADLSLRTEPNYAFAAGTNSVPLMAVEFVAACKQYPILFSDGPVVQPVALLGLRTGENLFVDADGAWEEGAYVPAYVRRYPFIFLENEDGSQLTLCVDESADAVVPGRDNPFFVDGQPSALTSNALEFVKEVQAQNGYTTEFVAAVTGAGLLSEKRADITLNSGERLSLAGFKVIDEAAFNQLPAEELVAWRDRGWLGLVYAHLISVSSWSGLVDRLASRD